MDAAIRWSPHAPLQSPRFLIIDVAGNRLRLCQIDQVIGQQVKYRQICVRDKLPNFTAFDWSKKDESVVSIGSALGEAIVVRLDTDQPQKDHTRFPIRHQRKCNSIAFSTQNLLATGLDRVRNDVCLNIYDWEGTGGVPNPEPVRKLASSEAISSIKFFSNQPEILVAGVSRQYIRIYDLRDPSGQGVAQYSTRQVHNIAIDPLDENYFISAGTTGDPTVTVWDSRFAKQGGSNEQANHVAILDFRPIVDNSQSATIWSLRYSGTKRGTFGVLANTGEFKTIELAQHSHYVESQASTQGSAWSSPHYTKFSHTLRHPWYDQHARVEGLPRVVAYDFVTNDSLSRQTSALVLYPNKDVGVLKIPPPAPKLNVTALGEIYSGCTVVAKPSEQQGTVAEDLVEFQKRTLDVKPHIDGNETVNLRKQVEKVTFDYIHCPASQNSGKPSSCRMHDEILTLAYPYARLPLEDYLQALHTQKRRCKEGYNLDCRKNKSIVANDPWLIDSWNLVERMDHHSWAEGMVGGGLDLKFLGVASIWANELTMYDQGTIDPDPKTSRGLFVEAVKEICELKEFSPFSGATTKFPENRQLCLSLCGWSLSKGSLQNRCSGLVERGQYYKAIVLAVFQGHKDVALDLLKEAIQAKRIENIGLGAVIACDAVNEDQRHLCGWMADVTDEPYLKGLLTYFITGDWQSVVEMDQLLLTDRVGIALKYLPDNKLTDFLTTCTQQAISSGNIEGLLLTGLTNRTVDLLEQYIAKFGDLQSAVLILSRACPLYVEDARWPLWKEMYLDQMQVWRTFLERTHYIKEHNLRSMTSEGRSAGIPPSNTMALRCYNCQHNLALRKDPRTSRRQLVVALERGKHKTGPKSRLHPSHRMMPSPSLGCPNCGAQMPRCGLCMMWLGSPDPSKYGAAQTLKDEDLEARLMVFCMNCTHGFHGHHARDWFARHAMCPVPDCQCMCGLLK